MANAVPTRKINDINQRELWARSAGRCQFNGCNRPLYQSPITLEQVNISEQAHIYSFSENGPRGHEPYKEDTDALNSVENLMLMCHDCHKTIDQDKDGSKYSGEMLRAWKRQHEERIYITSGIVSSKKTHVVLYGANIGEQNSRILKSDALTALFPDHYPTSEKPIELSMVCFHEDSTDEFWRTEQAHLERAFGRSIEPLIIENDPSHFSLFALAPMPLLIKLGALFTDKISVDVYQPIREPNTWRWQSPPIDFDFQVIAPESTNSPPALVISLSGKIDHGRLKATLGDSCSVWEITVADNYRHNDFMKSTEQLSKFRSVMRKLISQITEAHGAAPLSIFPAMPVSCAFEMGRIRMPKADMPWVIYDQNRKLGKFIYALTIGETDGQHSKK